EIIRPWLLLVPGKAARIFRPPAPIALQLQGCRPRPRGLPLLGGRGYRPLRDGSAPTLFPGLQALDDSTRQHQASAGESNIAPPDGQIARPPAGPRSRYPLPTYARL